MKVWIVTKDEGSTHEPYRRIKAVYRNITDADEHVDREEKRGGCPDFDVEEWDVE